MRFVSEMTLLLLTSSFALPAIVLIGVDTLPVVYRTATLPPEKNRDL